MQAPEMVAVRAARARAATRPPRGTQTCGDGEVQSAVAEPSPWDVIWSVGGLCWLVVTGTALLWILPTSPIGGERDVVSTKARVVQHLPRSVESLPE